MLKIMWRPEINALAFEIPGQAGAILSYCRSVSDWFDMPMSDDTRRRMVELLAELKSKPNVWASF